MNALFKVLNQSAPFAFLYATYYSAFELFNQDLSSAPFTYGVLQSSIVLNMMSLSWLVRNRNGNKNLVCAGGWMTSALTFYFVMTGVTFNFTETLSGVNDDVMFGILEKIYYRTFSIMVNYFILYEGVATIKVMVKPIDEYLTKIYKTCPKNTVVN